MKRWGPFPRLYTLGVLDSLSYCLGGRMHHLSCECFLFLARGVHFPWLRYFSGVVLGLHFLRSPIKCNDPTR